MAIEVFLIEEAEQLIADPEKTDEWHKTVQELGLEGQQTLANDPEKSPIPFLRLRTGEQRVYATLCPRRDDVKQYRGATIPLRVLSLIALAEREKYFDHIQIWHNEQHPDPVAIGIKGSTYSGDMFLIARWGDELRSYAELEQIAIKRWIEEKTNLYEDKLKNINSAAYKYFKIGADFTDLGYIEVTERYDEWEIEDIFDETGNLIQGRYNKRNVGRRMG